MITLGTCIPLNARISQRQCDINRKGLPYKPAKPGQPAQPQRPPCLSCTGCPGLSSLQTADVQLIIVSKPVDTAPVEALVPVLPLPPKKRGGGTQKPAKTQKNKPAGGLFDAPAAATTDTEPHHGDATDQAPDADQIDHSGWLQMRLPRMETTNGC